MAGHDFDPLDFQPNSLGVRIVRPLRLKDVMRALDCTEERAHEVVREISGDRSFVLPSQLAAWAYARAGKPVAPSPSSRTAPDVPRRVEPPSAAEARPSGATTLREIRSDLRRLKSTAIQPGALAITIEQAAARLGCRKTKVFELLASGDLKRGKKVGRHAMVMVASIDAFLQGGASVARASPKPKAPAAPETAAEILRKLRQRT